MESVTILRSPRKPFRNKIERNTPSSGSAPNEPWISLPFSVPQVCLKGRTEAWGHGGPSFTFLQQDNPFLQSSQTFYHILSNNLFLREPHFSQGSASDPGFQEAFRLSLPLPHIAFNRASAIHVPWPHLMTLACVTHGIFLSYFMQVALHLQLQ